MKAQVEELRIKESTLVSSRGDKDMKEDDKVNDGMKEMMAAEEGRLSKTETFDWNDQADRPNGIGGEAGNIEEARPKNDKAGELPEAKLEARGQAQPSNVAADARPGEASPSESDENRRPRQRPSYEAKIKAREERRRERALNKAKELKQNDVAVGESVNDSHTPLSALMDDNVPFHPP